MTFGGWRLCQGVVGSPLVSALPSRLDGSIPTPLEAKADSAQRCEPTCCSRHRAVSSSNIDINSLPLHSCCRNSRTLIREGIHPEFLPCPTEMPTLSSSTMQEVRDDGNRILNETNLVSVQHNTFKSYSIAMLSFLTPKTPIHPLPQTWQVPVRPVNLTAQSALFQNLGLANALWSWFSVRQQERYAKPLAHSTSHRVRCRS